MTGCNPLLPDLLHGPRDPAQPFVLDGAGFAEVYRLAARLRDAGAEGPRPLLCLATEDKGLIAAALLASLAGGPILLLPHALSRPALTGLHQATGCTLALADPGRDLPSGLTPLELNPAQRAYPGSCRLPADAELLRLYTGGSTGAPQLWSKTVDNIFAEALFLANRFAVGAHDRILATIPPYHIYGLLYSVALPLVSGASVVSEAPSYPAEIERTARERRATLLISVPAHYRALRGKANLGPSLRLAFSSAGPLDPEDNAAFCGENPAGIVEVYGSTETGGIGLRSRMRGESGFTPYSTVQWRISNDRLAIRSPYLSPGLARAADGFFLTADRVQACGDTGFILAGRVDSVTKVAGKRVDMEEIRTVIQAEPGVRDCLVLALDDPGSREHRIVALIEGKDADADRIRGRLAARFEPYALPRALKIVDRLPIRENGKHDRAAIARLFGP